MNKYWITVFKYSKIYENVIICFDLKTLKP